MVLVATLTAAFVTNGGRSAWFVGVLVLMVYMIFAMTLYLLPRLYSEIDLRPLPSSGIRRLAPMRRLRTATTVTTMTTADA
jgi:hypothetical protein